MVTVGRVVHLTVNEELAETLPGAYKPGAVIAAHVVRVEDSVGTVSLAALTPSQPPMMYVPAVPYAGDNVTEPGCWHWPQVQNG
mgnify:CR=1 FL=1